MLYPKEITDRMSEYHFAYLDIAIENHILTMTLNRPEKKNAMDPTLFREIGFALSKAHHDTDVWGVVVAANGDIFCAGADLKAFAGKVAPNDSTVPLPENEVVLGDLFAGLHKPCIAKVHAPVYAGGFLLICGCTHVVASKNAKFGLPEVKRGIWPMQVMQSMLKIMPARTVLDFCMRARVVDSEEALRLGLITHSVEDNELDSTVDALLKETFTNSPAAINIGLKAYDELKHKSDADAHQYLYGMLQKVLQTEDAAEGLQAFMEKRPPVWKGK